MRSPADRGARGVAGCLHARPGIALLVVALLMADLAGCAWTAAPDPERVAYRCDGGREFALVLGPEGRAAIEISGMRFALHAEPGDGTGQRFQCSELTVWRDGADARVAFAAGQTLSHCRAQPAR